MKNKICFAASSGGHLEEISRIKELCNQNKDFVLTERGDYEAINWCKTVYYVNQINRKEQLFLLKFICLFFRSFYIFLKEQPDVLITTGALATVPICLIGKILRRKIIYIESFARVEEGSLTGKIMYKVADLFIVQWEELLKIYPNAVYGGGIF